MNGEWQNIISFAEFELDLDRRQLRRGDTLVRINAKTFDLLAFLIANNGRIVTKDEILEAVWAGHFVEEANLSVQMSALRKTFGETKNAPRFLVTIPGVGYKFVADVNRDGDEYVIEKHKIERLVIEESEEREEETRTNGEEEKNHLLPKVSPSPFLPFSPSKTLPLAFAGLAVLSLLAFAGYKYFYAAPKTRINSIAVLPFKPLVVESRNESLEMGMADTLIAKLSNFRNINVRPISAVRKYVDLEQDAIAAGREQQVDAVLDGQIQQSGDKIRMTVRLIDVADGKQIWTNQFDEKWTDIFAVQDSISERIAGILALKLSGEEKQRLKKHHTGNAEAYQLYLLGRFHLSKRTKEPVKKSLDYFNQAIEKDPNYAAAYSGLADAYSTSGWFEFLPPGEAYSKAREAADRALQIDESLADAYAVLGDIKRGYDWDLSGAESSYKRAIELDARNPMTFHSYGLSLGLMGRQEESIAALRKALELDPLSVVLNKTYGDLLMFARRYDESIAQYGKTLELEANNPYTYVSLGLCYFKKRLNDRAVAEFFKAASLSGKETGDVDALKSAYRRSGINGFWQELIKQNTRETEYVSSYNIAAIYAAAGDTERSLEWLEKAYREHSSGMTAIKVDPMFDNLHSEPRFMELTRRVGLP